MSSETGPDRAVPEGSTPSPDGTGVPATGTGPADEPAHDGTGAADHAGPESPTDAAEAGTARLGADEVPANAASESPTVDLDTGAGTAAASDPPPTGFGATSWPSGHQTPNAGYPGGGPGRGGAGGTPPPPPPGATGTGSWADEPPPITGFARRHRLIRPVQGKKIAGVCAALGRATDTDPVLWRVVFAVLVFFGGIGLLAYVVGWLAMPREDDQAAPVESLVGRGRSSTSPLLTVVLGIIAIGLVFAVFNSRFAAMVLVVGVAVVIAVALTRRNQARTDADGAGSPVAAAPGTGGPAGAAAAGGGAAPDPGAAPAGWAATAPTANYRVTAGPYTVPPTGTHEPGYRAPFAPHGPYAPGTASPTGSGEVPIGGGAPPPPPPPQYRPKPPKPPKQKSILGRLTFFVLCLAIGGLAVLAAAGLGVPASAYFAVGLMVIGAGLVFGAWRGRARWLIALGCVFALALPIAWTAERANFNAPDTYYRYSSPGDHVWAPRDVTQLRDEYNGSVGDATLDLSSVDFTGRSRTVILHDPVGDVKVLLPSDVDTTVTLEPGLGDATLFGQPVRSPHNRTQTRTNYGPDGAGGGTLQVTIRADAGDVEVIR